MNRVKIGEIVPLCSENMRGMELWGDYLKMSGLVISAVHPSSIAVSDGAIDFSCTVGGKNVIRTYALERSDSKIVAFTNPDGTRTEVVRNG